MSPYKTWFLAARPWSFSMSAISVTIGSLFALGQGFSPGLYVLTLVGMVSIHAAANLLNDYYDVKNKVDSPHVPTAKYRPHPLMNQEISLSGVRNLALGLYGLGCAIGLFLAAVRGWPVLAIGLAGVAVSMAYTAPPLSLKYRALGEPAVFLLWGVLAVCGAYYVQVQAASWAVFLVSLPFGVLVALVLLANNIRDRQWDQAPGRAHRGRGAGAKKGPVPVRGPHGPGLCIRGRDGPGRPPYALVFAGAAGPAAFRAPDAHGHPGRPG